MQARIDIDKLATPPLLLLFLLSSLDCRVGVGVGVRDRHGREFMLIEFNYWLTSPSTVPENNFEKENTQ